MGVKVSPSDVPANSFEGITLNASDFNAAPDEGTTIQAGEVTEVFRSELGEDGQLASYSALQLGQPQGGNPNSAEGKLFVSVKNTSDNDVDQRTQVRFIARPKNANNREPLTDWMPVRDLDRDRPDLRMALSPQTNGEGDAQVVQDGRIIAMEVRNESTSFEVSLSNSVAEIPAIAGY